MLSVTAPVSWDCSSSWWPRSNAIPGLAYILGYLVRASPLYFISLRSCGYLTRPHSFIWSISNITLARLILNLRRLSNSVSDEAGDEEVLSDDAKKSAEQMELPMLRK